MIGAGMFIQVSRLLLTPSSIACALNKQSTDEAMADADP